MWRVREVAAFSSSERGYRRRTEEEVSWSVADCAHRRRAWKSRPTLNAARDCHRGIPGYGSRTVGTYFQCQRCTACCRWPGDVRLNEAEVPVIAGFLGLSVYDFVQLHTRLNRSRTGLSLLEEADGTCVWLDGIDCRLQPVKPDQCRGFPNTWNFPGWRDVCEAVEVEVEE